MIHQWRRGYFLPSLDKSLSFLPQKPLFYGREDHSYSHYYIKLFIGIPNGKAAVMQICGGTDCCHVLHIIHSGIPQSLQLLLEDPTILKVGPGIASDARKVYKDHDISIKGVEDLSFHAKQKLGEDIRNRGLASLTEKLLSKQLLKPSKIRLGNWETRPLSNEQLEYAATDAFASWCLYQVIRDLPDAQQVVVGERGDVKGVVEQN